MAATNEADVTEVSLLCQITINLYFESFFLGYQQIDDNFS